MTGKVIPFLHRYHKLKQGVFTTIRGKTWMKKFKVGDITECDTPGGIIKVRVEAMELRKVSGMGLDLVKKDAEYPGYTINSLQDFIALLNSFRAPSWQQVGFDSEMTVLTLTKL